MGLSAGGSRGEESRTEGRRRKEGDPEDGLKTPAAGGSRSRCASCHSGVGEPEREAKSVNIYRYLLFAAREAGTGREGRSSRSGESFLGGI